MPILKLFGTLWFRSNKQLVSQAYLNAAKSNLCQINFDYGNLGWNFCHWQNNGSNHESFCSGIWSFRDPKATRSVIASIFLWFLVSYRKVKLPKLNLRQTLLVVCLGLSGVLAYNLFFFLGLKEISASRAGLIIALNPVCITVASRIFFQEKLTYFKWIGVALSLFGAILIITEGNIGTLFSQGIDRGELLIFGCVVSWVVYSLVGKLVMQKFSALVTTTYAIWVGTVLLLPFAIWEQNNRLPDIDVFTGLGLAYLGILATVIAFN